MPRYWWSRVFHWGPLFALFIIGEISITGLFCLLQWWPINTLGGFIHLIVYLNWDVMILYNFFTAMYTGPGLVPLQWQPKRSEDKKFLQFCDQCEGFKPPRSHHCRKCDRCVMKMDHHCPWINNCVGHFNHKSFTYFVLIAPMGCVHAAIVLCFSVYHAMYTVYYWQHKTGPIIQLGVYSLLASILGIGLAIGVTIAVWILFFIQFRSVLRNETGIETWIREKAYYRRDDSMPQFEFPYNLGRWRNFKLVFGSEHYKLDGIWWPVKPGCNQFTLTAEQIAQKKEKHDHMMEGLVVEAFSGSLCPITKGCQVFCCPPLSDEPRIPLRINDQVNITRAKKHWMYGDKVLTEEDKLISKRVRGWFPRRCVIRTKRTVNCDGGDSVHSNPNQSEEESSTASLADSSKKKK